MESIQGRTTSAERSSLLITRQFAIAGFSLQAEQQNRRNCHAPGQGENAKAMLTGLPFEAMQWAPGGNEDDGI